MRKIIFKLFLFCFFILFLVGLKLVLAPPNYAELLPKIIKLVPASLKEKAKGFVKINGVPLTDFKEKLSANKKNYFNILENKKPNYIAPKTLSVTFTQNEIESFISQNIFPGIKVTINDKIHLLGSISILTKTFPCELVGALILTPENAIAFKKEKILLNNKEVSGNLGAGDINSLTNFNISDNLPIKPTSIKLLPGKIVLTGKVISTK